MAVVVSRLCYLHSHWRKLCHLTALQKPRSTMHKNEWYHSKWQRSENWEAHWNPQPTIECSQERERIATISVDESNQASSIVLSYSKDIDCRSGYYRNKKACTCPPMDDHVHALPKYDWVDWDLISISLLPVVWLPQFQTFWYGLLLLLWMIVTAICYIHNIVKSIRGFI